MGFLNEKDSCGTGFIVNTRGKRSHSIVSSALEALANLNHRGAVSADGKTGDGAGILTQIPHKFFKKELEKVGIEIPKEEDFAVGVFFLPSSRKDEIQSRITEIIGEKFDFLGWRKIPTNEEILGEIAQKAKPELYHAFISRRPDMNPEDFERQLFIIRKKLEKLQTIEKYRNFYVPSLSSKTIVYKGLVIAPMVSSFFLDLQDSDYESSIAVFHQRYSTNTSPNWKLAQPFRMLAHNGEINTITANRNSIRAKTKDIREVWGELADDILPLVSDEDSDSASLDNILEFLVHSGKDPLVAINMLIPKAWEKDQSLTPDERAFYEYFSCNMENWDGPASIVFTDGKVVVGKLDRNGLRPARYTITDEIVILASEAGVIDIPEASIIKKGRLSPGDKIAVDTGEGKIYFSEEIIDKIMLRKEYRSWLEQNMKHFKCDKTFPELGVKDCFKEQILFGIDSDELEMVVKQMCQTAAEATYSMGSDIPISVLSLRPKLLSSYFRQKFAQVTNPPIDSIREKNVMCLRTFVGRRRNFLLETPEHAGLLYVDSPVILEHEYLGLLQEFKSKVKIIPAYFEKSQRSLENALFKMKEISERAVEEGFELIVISDRDLPKDTVPIPMGLAISAVNSHLSEKGIRMKVSLIADSGEARDTHSIAFLIGYGATLVNPYLTVQVIRNLLETDEKMKDLSFEKALSNYKESVNAGLLKIMAKMGIATVRSYKGSALFEALGISQSVIEEYFSGTPSQIDGLGIKEIAWETILRYEEAMKYSEKSLPKFGEYRYRQEGEFHSWNPVALKALHKSVREGDMNEFRKFSNAVYEQKPANIRDLFRIESNRASIPLDEVEPIENITKRFVGAAMSIGALSKEAHETIAQAMNFLGAKSNSGEGGEDPARYNTDKNSKIKQVASGRFGVTPEYLNSAEEIEIKVAQGAKPGEGGQLPGKKVNEYIAYLRYSQPGVTLISPPPHHDIYSIEDLAQLIFDLKMINPRAKIIVKLVSEVGIGTIASGVAKAFADVIHISGADGGTGASPLSSIKNAGSIWETGLTEVQQALIRNNLRGNVKLRVDGGIKTGRDIVIAALLGAEEFGFGTSLMVAGGCSMIRQCHLNSCPVGVATQDPELRKKFKGEVIHIINYLKFVATEVRQILADSGYRSLEEITGRIDLLKPIKREGHPKAKHIKLSKILDNPASYGKARKWKEFRELPKHEFYQQLLSDVLPYIEKEKDYSWVYRIRNVHRSVGTSLSHEIVKRYGNSGLTKSKIELKFQGTAGQSFGAFCVNGLELLLKGQANDYVGKGMHGGVISIKPFVELRERSSQNVIIGNTVLYGATGGKLFAAGQAGERFAVRNSGATAVIEGVGDHACEYMTGGTVLILGGVGMNFGAGMTGGIVYVHASNSKSITEEKLKANVNSASVEVVEVNSGDKNRILEMLEEHLKYTNSKTSEDLLIGFEKENFLKIIPKKA